MAHHHVVVSLYIPSLFSEQIVLQDIWIIIYVEFRLLGSLGGWIPFPQHQIPTVRTCALMPKNPLDLILQSISHQYRRRRLDLPQELLRANIAFKLADVEEGMDPLTRGQIQSKCNW